MPSLQPPGAGSKGFRESGNITLLPPQKNPPAFSTLKRVYRGQCIHRVYSTPGNRLSDFSPLLDVLTVGGKMLPGKVLQQSGNAHATPTEPADDGVQFVPHILTDEHRLAVPNLRDGEVCFSVLLQRGPTLPGRSSFFSRGLPVPAGCPFFPLPRTPLPQRPRDGITGSASVPADSPEPGSIMSLSHHSSWPAPGLRPFFLSAASDTAVFFPFVFSVGSLFIVHGF